jgi:hypothetical protein
MDEHTITDLALNSKSLLHDFCEGMAIGPIPDVENIKDHPLQVKEQVITYAAADLIQTEKGGGLRGSSLKNAISNLMICTAVSNLVVNVLCLLGLSRHRTNLAGSSYKAVKETLEDGWDLTGKGYGCIQGPYDNAGFRKACGYKQFTLLAVVFYSVVSVIRLGVYQDTTRSIHARVLSVQREA